MRSFACRFFDFGFVNCIVQFQLIEKVRGNAKSLRVTKALDLFSVKSCSIWKADPGKFRSSYWRLRYICIMLALSFWHICVFVFLSFRHFCHDQQNVCSHSWSYFIQPKYICSQEQLSRSKRQLLLIFIPSFLWRLKTNIL